MSAGKAFWTSGVKNLTDAGGWHWSSGEVWSYSNWRSGEPNNYSWPGDPGENCLMINWDGVAGVNGLFNDLWCDYEIGFICQIINKT